MSKGLFGQGATSKARPAPTRDDSREVGELYRACGPDQPTVVMLDLNYTTVANSKECFAVSRDYRYQIPHEVYRVDLIDALRARHPDLKVAIVTHRWERFRVPTLERMAATLSGWQPDSCHFNPGGYRYVADWKRAVLHHAIPDLYDGHKVFALESNSRTAAMYQGEGVPACRYERFVEWTI